MSKYAAFLMIGILFTGCSSIDRMNTGIEKSISTVSANTQAVENSTKTIRANSESVDLTTKILQENSEGISKNLQLMQESSRAVHDNTQAVVKTTALMEAATRKTFLIASVIMLILLLSIANSLACFFVLRKFYRRMKQDQKSL